MEQEVSRNEVRWYPMHVSYHREMAVKEALEARGIVCYVPLVTVAEKHEMQVVARLEPAIHNLIFVHSSREIISGLKMYDRACSAMQYMVMKARTDKQASMVLTVGQRQMENFMKAMDVYDERNRRVFMPFEYFKDKAGRAVRFIDGDFKGVEGTIARVNKNRSVVITMEHIGSLIITIEHASDIEFIE